MKVWQDVMLRKGRCKGREVAYTQEQHEPIQFKDRRWPSGQPMRITSDNTLAWPPLQSLAVNFFFFWCKFWAVKNFYNLLKSAGEIFLSGLRGANNFSNAFRIVFRILFRVFQTVFRIDLKIFRGQFRSADMPP